MKYIVVISKSYVTFKFSFSNSNDAVDFAKKAVSSFEKCEDNELNIKLVFKRADLENDEEEED